MFNKILIANRGEIACRIINTARRLHIQTVAVYSTIDADAKHVALADEAIAIGESPANQSYLVIEKIIAACKQTGAQAVHPGYGFLSENAAFAKACLENHIVFIGPTPESISAMANKDRAKTIMHNAGIPVTLGDASEALSQLKKAASKIGVPLLIKAKSGGGGKGMRIVHHLEDFDQLAASAKREAKSNFNDDSIFIEKYVEQARHVEVQVCRDKFGNVVHLFDRDCSLQRRHQKIIEEAPAPFLSEKCRQKMFQAACKAAETVDYHGVGTIEYLVTPNEDFYFMEMNTRLQVEHPVTEEITGIDLVEWQFLVADNQALPLKQSDIQYTQKHAIEVRLCAEIPEQAFKPSTGKINYLRFAKMHELRTEAGYRQGDEVSVYYDSLLAKLICTSKNRQSAIEKLCEALIDSTILGIETNRQYLLTLLQQAKFQQGELSTEYLNSMCLPEKQESDSFDCIAAIAVVYYECYLSNMKFGGFRLNQSTNYTMTFFNQDKAVVVNCKKLSDGYEFQINETIFSQRFTMNQNDCESFSLQADEKRFHVTKLPLSMHCQSAVCELTLQMQLPVTNNFATKNENALMAKMPSTVVEVLVKVGESVGLGDQLMILEAMKIETTITAPKAGVIKTLFFQAGDVIREGELLLEFDV
ncbi:MAG: hypothetical protein A3F17_06000 [Gammaproteobacteria bacterium RIFCSPHIGHO2_12_FULL_41_15]|nr:MAG: hypothetical protein A3F17_06000 [Gammaproteobacteria bacterium RIFCSPHIGHO2_12_FULL_41_15]